MKGPPRRRSCRVFLIILAIALLLTSVCTAATTETRSGRVLRVHDGDTVEVAGFGKVRLLGIDAPERENSDRDRFLLRQGIPADRLRRIHAEARAFVMAVAQGRTVTLTFDGEERDRHGRWLAYVTLPDGRLLNRLLLEEGLAAVYRRFDFRLKTEFLAAEREARRRQIGLWAKQE